VTNNAKKNTLYPENDVIRRLTSSDGKFNVTGENGVTSGVATGGSDGSMNPGPPSS